MFIACACPATFEHDTMKKSSFPPHLPVALPPLVADYVEATNNSNLERLMATFAEDALVNDQLRDYWGKPTIRECWGHMPRHMVAEDLANGTLVELRRRARHMRPLTFMISQQRGHSFSECGGDGNCRHHHSMLCSDSAR
jgi:hypothetical protein